MEQHHLDGAALRGHFTGRWAESCGLTVAKRRTDLHLSAASVCTQLDVTIQTLWKIEHGKMVPRDYLRHGLAFVLCCEVEDLYPPVRRRDLAEYVDVAA